MNDKDKESFDKMFEQCFKIKETASVDKKVLEKYTSSQGAKHRLKGPAIVYEDGAEEYWILGREYDHDDYWQALYELGLIDKEQLVIECL